MTSVHKFGFSHFAYLVGILIIAAPMSLQAQGDSSRQKKFRLSPLPVIYYSPETRFGYGALLAVNFETVKKPDQLTKTSYIQNSFIRTINDQFSFLSAGR